MVPHLSFRVTFTLLCLDARVLRPDNIPRPFAQDG
jgi:hypothetical protein